MCVYLLTATCTFGKMTGIFYMLHKGWNGYENESAQKVDPGEENLPTAPAGTQTHDLSITSLALYH